MSSILLSTPFIPPNPPTQAASETPPAFTVSALHSAGNSQGAMLDNSGAGTGGQSGHHSAARSKTARPTDASPASVIDALVKDVRDKSPTRGAQEEDALQIGPNLPEVPMPDPLPTSPFLKPG